MKEFSEASDESYANLNLQVNLEDALGYGVLAGDKPAPIPTHYQRFWVVA